MFLKFSRSSSQTNGSETGSDWPAAKFLSKEDININTYWVTKDASRQQWNGWGNEKAPAPLVMVHICGDQAQRNICGQKGKCHLIIY